MHLCLFPSRTVREGLWWSRKQMEWWCIKMSSPLSSGSSVISSCEEYRISTNPPETEEVSVLWWSWSHMMIFLVWPFLILLLLCCLQTDILFVVALYLNPREKSFRSDRLWSFQITDPVSNTTFMCLNHLLRPGRIMVWRNDAHSPKSAGIYESGRETPNESLQKWTYAQLKLSFTALQFGFTWSESVRLISPDQVRDSNWTHVSAETNTSSLYMWTSS